MMLERAPVGTGWLDASSGGRLPIPRMYGGVGPDHATGTGGGGEPARAGRRFTYVPSGIRGPPACMTPGHRYVTPEGRAYASVTTVLGATKPEEDARGLEDWRRRVGYDVADHITREAAVIGTQAHQLNEYYVRGMVPDESDEPFKLMARAHHENFLPHLDRIDMVRGTELVLHSDNLQLAGTSDCIAEYDGVLSIIDYKTKRGPQKPGWVHDYYLQAAAYMAMYYEMSGVLVEQAVILASSEGDTMQVFKARTRDYIDEFLGRLNAWQGLLRAGGDGGGAVADAARNLFEHGPGAAH